MITIVTDANENNTELMRFIEYNALSPEQEMKWSYRAACALGKHRGNCLLICYPYIIKLTQKANVSIRLFSVCQKCLQTTGARELFLNLKDYFIANELAAWGRKEISIIKNDFDAFNKLAIRIGVFDRERMRGRTSKSHKEKLKKLTIEKLFKGGSGNLLYRKALNQINRD